jgi:hypothetical protein
MNTITAPGGLHRDFLEARLPAWLKHAQARDLTHLRDTQVDAQYSHTAQASWFSNASAAHQRALLAAQARLRHSKRGLAGLLKGLKGITEFAEPLLKARLKADHGLELDVNTAQWTQVTRTWYGNGRWQRLGFSSQSLLQAALQNFPEGAQSGVEAYLSLDGQHEVANEVMGKPAAITFTQPIALQPAQFARVCHDLDLGRRYQEHLQGVYDVPLSSSRIRYRSIEVYKELLRVQAYIAAMKSELSPAALDSVLAWLDGDTAARYAAGPLSIEQLSLYGVPLSNAWLLRGGAGEDGRRPVIVYMPGAALYPLKEYASLRAFTDDLRISLGQRGYQQLVCSYVPKAQEVAFAERLRTHLYTYYSTVYDSQLDPAANLKLASQPIAGDFLKWQQDQHLRTLKADAKVLIVPSADVDAQASAARWAYWESWGESALNVMALFVPALVPVMALVMAEQMMLDAVDGAQDWSNGDRDAAWRHLRALALNVAAAAGLAAAGAVTVSMLRSHTLDQLVKVTLPSGAQRLWRPQLAPYARAVDLAEQVPDAAGLYTVDGQRYARIDEQAYPVAQRDDGQWQIVPREPDAYHPLLSSNGQGAWRAQGEQPLQWNRRQLLRRLGPLTDGLSDGQLVEAAQASGTSEAQLRQVHVDQTPAPPALADILQRMQLDRQVDRLVAQVRSGGGTGSEQGYLPPLAVQLPHWPGRVIEVFAGPEPWGASKVYGRLAFPEGLPIKLTRDELYAGTLPEKILAAFDEAAAQQVFGDAVAPRQRLQALRDKLAERAEASRASLKESLAQAARGPRSRAMQRLQRDFPLLTDAAATQVVKGATSAELRMLEQTPGRLSLRLAEQARAFRGVLRTSRALDGMRAATRASLDSDRLALRYMEQLPGWTGDVRLELTELHLHGKALDAVGPTEGVVKTLVRAEGYRVFDAEGHELGISHDIYGALLKALPDSERLALGFAIGDSQRLRAALTARALDARELAAQWFGETLPRPWFKGPTVLAQGAGYRLSGDAQATAAAVGGRYSPELVGRTRSLYPAMDDAAAIEWLDALERGEAELLTWLEQRSADLRQLRSELDAWVAVPQSVAVGADRVILIPTDSLRTAADEIERAFRRQTPQVTSDDGLVVGHAMNLSGIRLSKLPNLSVDMSHVVSVKLARMSLVQVPDAFLRNFTALRWLDLHGNRLAQVPEAVGRCPRLTKLFLHGNRLTMAAADQGIITALRHLKILTLEGNLLGAPPDLSGLTDLRLLSLRRTGITGWPRGIFELERLVQVDMRNNAIAHIPEEVLAPSVDREPAVRAVNAATSLEGNPLNADSRLRLRAYRQRTGLDFGIGNLETQREVAVSANSAAQWLVGTPATDVVAQETVWVALMAEEGSSDFFEVLASLRGSAEYQRAYRDLKARVWHVVESAAQNSRLREELFELAAHPDTCADGILMVFNNLELRVLVSEAGAASSQAGAEYRLMNLAHGLFRLEQVERIALDAIKARRAAQRGVDEVEVRLAFRTGLAQALELPGQPRHMNFREIAGITQADLDKAEAEVLAAQTPEALKASLLQRDFWMDFLRVQYRERFDTINAPYFARLDALDADKAAMSDRLYLDRVEKIRSRRLADEHRLAESLTVTLWNAQPAQVTRL